jgi:CO/xanthine dehydrogenase FAD-binding subunit
VSTRNAALTTAIAPETYAPTALGEALQLLRRMPDMEIWAGGTWWMHRMRTVTERPVRPVLAIHQVRELRRVVRSGYQVDVGSAVPAGRLLSVGERFLPRPVLHALLQLGPPPVRSLATIGGALCLPDAILPVTVALQLLDARIELRRHGNARWTPLAQFRDGAGALRIQPGEMVTRVRVPLQSWSHWDVRTFRTPFPAGGPSLSLVGAADIEKGVLNEFRYSVVINGIHQIRLREAETDVVGRSLPLSERDQRTFLSAMEAHPSFGSELDDLGRWRTSNGVRSFLSQLR